jgi:protein gp37
MHPDWITSLLHQCNDFDVPFHFKQWGQWVPVQYIQGTVRTRLIELNNERPVEMVKMSKKLTGRTLEGAIWDGVPHTPPIHA